MNPRIIYRCWQPGDDNAILPLVLPTGWVSEDHYRKQFNHGFEPEGIRLAIVDGRGVGHARGRAALFAVEGKIQKFGAPDLVVVAPNMRRRGIATQLMRELHAYFEQKGYRGSLLSTNTEGACQLYLKLGYRQVTRELRAQMTPSNNPSQLKWAPTVIEDLETLHRLREEWAKQNFPVYWDGESMEVHRFNLKQYHVLRRHGKIVGYAQWTEPSAHFPHGLIRDPVVPKEEPISVIESVGATISTPRKWQTFEGSKYEKALRLLGYTMEPITWFQMLLSFGQEVDLTGLHRTFW